MKNTPTARWAGSHPTNTRANGHNTTNNNQQPSKHPAHKTRPDQFIGREQIVIASYFHDSAAPIEFEDLEEALTSGHRAGEVRTYARKREFDTSPSGGDGGNRTPVQWPAPNSSPSAVYGFISQPPALRRLTAG